MYKFQLDMNISPLHTALFIVHEDTQARSLDVILITHQNEPSQSGIWFNLNASPRVLSN